MKRYESNKKFIELAANVTFDQDEIESRIQKELETNSKNAKRGLAV